MMDKLKEVKITLDYGSTNELAKETFIGYAFSSNENEITIKLDVGFNAEIKQFRDSTYAVKIKKILEGNSGGVDKIYILDYETNT